MASVVEISRMAGGGVLGDSVAYGLPTVRNPPPQVARLFVPMRLRHAGQSLIALGFRPLDCRTDSPRLNARIATS